MVKQKFLPFLLLLSLLVSCKSLTEEAPHLDPDLASLPVPAVAPEGKQWVLQEDVSDEFDYVSEAASEWSTFGQDKWYNFYHNGWNGPGSTYWQYDHVSVDGSNLVIRSSRNPSTSKMGVPGINAGCVTSSKTVVYPVYIEARVSVADVALASDVWLLSPDDTQEIDMLECYGGAYQGNEWFAQFIHMSHHSFVRSPFTDYQPRDQYSWVKKEGVESWGEYCVDGATAKEDRKYVRIAVNWVSPFHFEYYLDGELVRVLYHNAFASKDGGVWQYTYPTMTEGKLDMEGGYQRTVTYKKKSGDFDMKLLKGASEKSTVSVIDPYEYQLGTGFDKPMDIIINMESQNWHVDAGRTPSDGDLENEMRSTMLVDWIRIYKPE